MTTDVEVIEVWNENSPYEMTLELSNLTFNPTTSCSVERPSSRLRCRKAYPENMMRQHRLNSLEIAVVH